MVIPECEDPREILGAARLFLNAIRNYKKNLSDSDVLFLYEKVTVIIDLLCTSATADEILGSFELEKINQMISDKSILLAANTFYNQINEYLNRNLRYENCQERKGKIENLRNNLGISDKLLNYIQQIEQEEFIIIFQKFYEIDQIFISDDPESSQKLQAILKELQLLKNQFVPEIVKLAVNYIQDLCREIYPRNNKQPS